MIVGKRSISKLAITFLLMDFLAAGDLFAQQIQDTTNKGVVVTSKKDQNNARILDNQGLIEMAKAGLPLEVLLNKIKNSICRFSDNPKDLIALKKACDEAKVIQSKEDQSQLLNRVIELAREDQNRLKEVVNIAMNHFLNAETEAEYEQIIRGLLRHGKGIAPFLLEHWEEESERKRAGMLDALRQLHDKSEEIRDSVRLMLFDRSKKVRTKAAQCIAALAVPKTQENLIPLLKRIDQPRDGVAMALGYLGNPKSVEPLADLMARRIDDDLKQSIAFALGRLQIKNPKVLQVLRDAVLDPNSEAVRDQAAGALAIMGDEQVIVLVRKAFHRHMRGRADIIGHLKYFRRLPVVEFLIPLVGDDNKAVRQSALKTLNVLSGENYGYSIEAWNTWLFQIRTRPDWIGTDKQASEK